MLYVVRFMGGWYARGRVVRSRNDATIYSSPSAALAAVQRIEARWEKDRGPECEQCPVDVERKEHGRRGNWTTHGPWSPQFFFTSRAEMAEYERTRRWPLKKVSHAKHSGE